MKYLKAVAALGALALVGAGSAVVLESFGTVSGTADVKPAIKIVEVDYLSDSGAEYVKLYNPSSADVKLDGWKISDIEGTDTVSDLTIPSKGNAMIIEDSANTTDRTLPNFETVDDIGAGLANSPDKVFLEDGIEVDSVDFTDDPCSGDVLVVDWETGSTGCESSSYDFEGVLN
jgi:hypothetical protein